jgi:hypothetical protein
MSEEEKVVRHGVLARDEAFPQKPFTADARRAAPAGDSLLLAAL